MTAKKRPSRQNAAALLARAEALVDGLPEITIEHHGGHAGFQVAGRRFAWFLDDHHGDGMICLCVKTDPEEKEILIDLDPEKYLRPAYVSRFGWLSIRLDDRPVDWDELASRLQDSYRRVAPKRLLRQLTDIRH